MKLAPDVEFHEDIRLLIYRPRSSLNEASVNKIVNVIEDVEARLNEPFNRFFNSSHSLLLWLCSHLRLSRR
ncbi:MAG: hypothetical protein DME98_16420 [Verrucomicrobia bacterium]|nr:MAG: hypothetical protein DME98_16420 [Verrucomicrobiota bacterium]PYJ36011.1 MAG: hypothetical protein DME88_00030 [Verrucomicrobiota bacterium]